MTDKQEDLDSINQDGGKPITVEDIEAAKAAGDLEKVSELAVKLAGSNSKLYERAKKAEGDLKDAKAKPDPEKEKDKKPDPHKKVDEDQQDPKKHPDYSELRFDGYSEEEATFIVQNGGRKALEQEGGFVKTAIESKRAEKKKKETTEEATPASAPKSPVFKHYTEEELRRMKPAELEKILPKSDK